MKVGKNIRFFGKVQKVGFRETLRTHASVLGLTGWVRNRSDGSVEAEAFGTKEKIDSFVRACKIGNAFSLVDSVVETEIGYQEFDSFFRKDTV